ncbi:hypothetical protein LRP30_33195 [Bradyrhizobium sp. C-145]|uniref:hypothetical protein n=1 Tax=Bradyrhizobium sp. C-145 TaxID=574727 RepID=UPI00201B8862|nr:hypothetical protein [Bradyrhizobium sp. C-145]UQR61641.1 hypothetical protein LRP30_33195 [Bradyrhizobium sp. C-145]
MQMLSRRSLVQSFLAVGSVTLAGVRSASAQRFDWLARLLVGASGAPPVDLTFIPSVQGAESIVPEVAKPIEPDACYIELYLESIRLAKARRFATRFHGVAYSFVTLAREGDARAQLAAISKPDKLAELDRGAIDKVIVVSKQMMGPTAYRGGPVLLQFGLFSVKSGNLLSPVLDYVTRVSSAAGNSYVGAIKPFLPLIAEGMDLIAGQREDTALEVGVDTAIDLKTGSVSAIVDLPRGSFNIDKLTLDKDRKLLLDGKPIDAGYAVFSFRPSAEKSDYGEIPELRDRYAAIQSALRGGKLKDAQDALAAFRLAAIASPDLIPADASKLVEKTTQKVRTAFPPGGVGDVSGPRPKAETLSEIQLYE